MMDWEKHFRQKRPLVTMTSGYSAGFGYEIPSENVAEFGTLLSDNIDAIQRYFAEAHPITSEATAIKDEFIKWIDSLWWYEKNWQSTYDLARNLRNRYDLANAVTPIAKAQVMLVQRTGLTTEQMQGLPDRRDSHGNFPGPTTPPKPPLIPWWVWTGGAVVAGLSAIAYSYGRATHIGMR